ncbi:MOT1 [Hepatospora eriocheir]|uniref:MOT1 n=1 Tax=Hepatospora eriocheir TaxID=1081669 RepID=A0A1X0Q902_9MICR|nr:MOT1 [Hepatospora eriocheir]
MSIVNLEKLIKAIQLSTNKELKRYYTSNLIEQLEEYSGYYLFILVQIYELIMSEKDIDRMCGTRILENMNIKIELSSKESLNDNELTKNFVYLKSKDFKVENSKKVKTIIDKEIQKEFNLEHVDTRKILKAVEGTDSTRNKELNTTDINDKEIKTIQDFFDNLVTMMLSPEWFKRHGSFLALRKIINCDTNKFYEVVHLNVNKIKQHALIILKHDKFVDFNDEVAKAPVREEAAELINYLELSNTEVEFINSCIVSNDWKEQVSGMLTILKSKNPEKFISKDIENRIFMLIKNNSDDDVKILAAKILSKHKCKYLKNDELVNICLEQLISIDQFSKFDSLRQTSLILLLMNVLDSTLKIEFFNDENNIDRLIDCISTSLTGSSYIRDIGLNFIKILLKEYPPIGNQLIYLVGEAVLFYDNKLALEILDQNRNLLDEEFFKHFFNICATSVFKSYDSNQFVCQEDEFFTEEGCKAIGYSTILNYRTRLLFTIPLYSISLVDSTNNSVLFDTFANLINYKLGILTASKIFINKDFIKSDYSKYSELNVIPVKELVNLINNPFYRSIAHNCNEKSLEYIRLCVSRNLENNFDFTKYFLIETSSELLKIIIQIKKEFIVKLHDVNTCKIIASSTDMLIKHFDMDVSENLVLFFEILGDVFLKTERFKNLLIDENGLKFFYNTIHIYKDVGEIEEVFNKCLDMLFVEVNDVYLTIVKKMIVCSKRYNMLFVKRSLELIDRNNMVPECFSLLIEKIDPSLYILFLKPFLKFGREYLSLIVAGLSLKLNQEILSLDTEISNKIIKAKYDAEMMFNPNFIPNFPVSKSCNVKLRDYQIDGIKWINFLFNFGLNGILADDMGLGKTIQILSYLITKIENKEIRTQTLIICPTILTNHWITEIITHFNYEDVVIFSKNCRMSDYSIVICTYDNLRKYEVLLKTKYSIVIFDEGHIMRNRNTGLYAKIKMLKFDHSIILTGTPVHNNVDDMFSLFDIIMPNYLGTIEAFNKTYGIKVNEKNINSFMKNQNVNFIDLLENRIKLLQKKILPFVMRRLKSEVLTDLPPKIIKDVYIQLLPSQAEAYHNVLISQEFKMSDKDSEVKDKGYKALHSNPLTQTKSLLKIASHTKYFDSNLQSPKTTALIEILNIFDSSKVLVFFQLKSTLKFVVDEIIKSKTNISFLTLDGEVKDRYGIVDEFNKGSCRCLLSTCSVGGLGLNLTSANVVVFYEHDWNPFNDLQAMDRVHRLGQKLTVEVFRLIAKDTIECKVMNYQNFKLHLASNVVTQQNTKVEDMEMHDLIERF